MAEPISMTIPENEDRLELSKAAWRDATLGQDIPRPEGAIVAKSSTKP